MGSRSRAAKRTLSPATRSHPTDPGGILVVAARAIVISARLPRRPAHRPCRTRRSRRPQPALLWVCEAAFGDESLDQLVVPAPRLTRIRTASRSRAPARGHGHPPAQVGLEGPSFGSADAHTHCLALSRARARARPPPGAGRAGGTQLRTTRGRAYTHRPALTRARHPHHPPKHLGGRGPFLGASAPLFGSKRLGVGQRQSPIYHSSTRTRRNSGRRCGTAGESNRTRTA
jgi:hypothetical protein